MGLSQNWGDTFLGVPKYLGIYVGVPVFRETTILGRLSKFGPLFWGTLKTRSSMTLATQTGARKFTRTQCGASKRYLFVYKGLGYSAAMKAGHQYPMPKCTQVLSFQEKSAMTLGQRLELTGSVLSYGPFAVSFEVQSPK